MAEPVRKLPAAGEPETSPASADPFRYGTRWRRVRLPSRQVTEQPIPLTPEDLLDPELGDELTQSGPHFNGRYRRIEPDSEGRLLSETTGLRFGVEGVEEDGKTLAILNAETGERLSSPDERARNAEAEVARLQMELAQLREKEAE